jgi:hypothetical protein
LKKNLLRSSQNKTLIQKPSFFRKKEAKKRVSDTLPTQRISKTPSQLRCSVTPCRHSQNQRFCSEDLTDIKRLKSCRLLHSYFCFQKLSRSLRSSPSQTSHNSDVKSNFRYSSSHPIVARLIQVFIYQFFNLIKIGGFGNISCGPILNCFFSNLICANHVNWGFNFSFS